MLTIIIIVLNLLWFIKIKFIVSRAIRIKFSEEIAYNVQDTFTFFEAPSTFHSDKGREFPNAII